MRTPLLIASFGLAAIAASTKAQGRQAPRQAKLTKLLEVDSSAVQWPALSPDGRWLAYTRGPMYENGRSIWIVKVGTNQARQLIKGEFSDEGPLWFPKGGRILFRSSRVDGALMVMGFNPTTGEATEAPRRLTLETAGAQNAISPDGRWVVYVAVGTPARHGDLRIIPSIGGTAKSLDSLPPGRNNGFLNPSFTADGRSVEYTTMDDKAEQLLKSVPISGGPIRVLLQGSNGSLIVGQQDDIVASWRRRGGELDLRNLRGDTLGIANLPGLMGGRTRFGSRPNTLVAITASSSSEVHVISTDGSQPRVIDKSTRSYIGGFLSGDRVLLTEHSRDRNVVDIVPLNGGAPKRITLPDSVNFESATIDGKLFYWKHGDVRGVYDVASGTSRLIAHTQIQRGGAGDYTSLLTSTSEYPYRQRNGDAIELRAWSPVTNTSRLIRSIAGGRPDGQDFTLRGDLAAYSAKAGDSISVFVAATPSSKPQLVIALRGEHTDGMSISRDGRHVVFGIKSIGGADTTHAIGFVDLNTDGTIAGPVRMVPVFDLTGITWLPNNTEVVYEAIEPSGETAMMRLANREGARPQVISQGERLHFYDFSVSPDGRWASYPVEQVGPLAIWRVDFAFPSQASKP